MFSTWLRRSTAAAGFLLNYITNTLFESQTENVSPAVQLDIALMLTIPEQRLNGEDKHKEEDQVLCVA